MDLRASSPLEAQLSESITRKRFENSGNQNEPGQDRVPSRKPSLVASNSLSDTSIINMAGLGKLFKEVRTFLRLLSFSTDKLLNSVFVKKLKSVTWGQTVCFAVVWFILYYHDSFGQRVDGPLVKTKQGFVQGITGQSRGGRVFYEYLGIPYAKPPVGDLRFEVRRCFRVTSALSGWKYEN